MSPKAIEVEEGIRFLSVLSDKTGKEVDKSPDRVIFVDDHLIT
jgi:hypothetical protein